MAAPTPYLLPPGTARRALEHYESVFGGELALFTFGQLGRTDGPSELIAHGELKGAVAVSAADAAPGESSLRVEGLLLALLGAADPAVLRDWFERLGDGGEVIDPLQRRPWGDFDGQVRDRWGVTWLIGWQGDSKG
ncbi:VOC family protein [Amnibacterium endophyticum]|uniref:VOC family protein n=1 Tax=Amnibacterium endophyticum TaxID=2109337 RepID=A0ABW4L8W6_9MICO